VELYLHLTICFYGSVLNSAQEQLCLENECIVATYPCVPHLYPRVSWLILMNIDTRVSLIQVLSSCCFTILLCICNSLLQLPISWSSELLNWKFHIRHIVNNSNSKLGPTRMPSVAVSDLFVLLLLYFPYSIPIYRSKQGTFSNPSYC